MFALRPTAGNVTDAVCRRSSSCGPVAFGSYLILIPVAVMTTTFGTVTFSVCTATPNLPGTLNAANSADGFCSACTACMTSTWTSNVTRIPVSVAVIPFELWPAVCWPFVPPNARLAESAPSPTVRLSFPSLNFVSTSETDGPAIESGPSENGVVAVPESVACESTVKVAEPRPAFASLLGLLA